MSFEIVINSENVPKIGGSEKGAFHPVTPDNKSTERKTDDEDVQDKDRNLARIPPMALEILSSIHEEPLPRPKTMSRILSKLLPMHALTDASIITAVTCETKSLRSHLGRDSNTSVAVSISSIPEEWSDPYSPGMGGVGKATMAAMVTTHHDVRRYYKDGIAWVNVGSQEMNYSRYVSCLKELLSQLIPEKRMPVFPVLLRTPGESSSTREGRQVGFMCFARDLVSQILRDRKVLIVLQNVEYSDDLDWFRFCPLTGSTSSVNMMGVPSKNARSLLVVTSRRDLLLPADTVEVDLLYDAEAIRLMVTESGQILDRTMAETREARRLVQVCADHPLAVKCVARWLSLKHAKQVAEAEQDSDDIQKIVHESLTQVAQLLNALISKNDDLSSVATGSLATSSLGNTTKSTGSGGDERCDAMYEILNMAFSPEVSGKPTRVIKYCFAALVMVFFKEEHHSLFSPAEVQPKIPMALVDMLLAAALKLEEQRLSQDGPEFFSQLRDATILIPEALAALGVVKVIHVENANTPLFDSASDMSWSDDSSEDADATALLQIMHRFFQEYGDFLATEDPDLQELCIDGERKWNKELVTSHLKNSSGWGTEESTRFYMSEMIISHMIRAGMSQEACQLMHDVEFVRARVECMGRKNATRQHITDCEALYELLAKDENDADGEKEKRSQAFMIEGYKLLGNLLTVDDSDSSGEDDDPVSFVETGTAHYEIGLSLAEKRCWDAAISHWETSEEMLVSSLGVEEFVAAVLFNIGVAYAEIHKHKKAMSFLKRCLRIRGAIHGDHHILFALTVQKIGDVFLAISDFEEAMECYTFALDVMYAAENFYRIDIGDTLGNMGNIHYSKGQIENALQCYQDALHSKKVELGEDHPELAATHQHIGNCLSDLNQTEDAIEQFDKAIWLLRQRRSNDDEQEAEALSIEGVLYNIQGRHEDALASYEKSLVILQTRVPHKKEKIAALLHLIGCVSLVTGDYDKAMDYFEQSLAARDKTLGFVQLEVASTLFNIAFIHQTCNRLKKALEFLEASLKIRVELLPGSEKVALTHEKIGLLSDIAGDTALSISSFKETLRIRRSIHGDSHELVGNVLQELGDLEDEMENHDEAMRCFEEALQIRKNHLGDDHEDVATTLYSMAFTFHHQEKTDEALRCFDDALKIRRNRCGEESREAAEVLNMMGCLKAKMGEIDGALSLLWEALKIRKLHNDVRKVADILKNIGNAHESKKEHELAAECYEECLRIRRDEFGDEHEKVADALIALGSVRSDHEAYDEGRNAYEEALSIRTLLYGNSDMRVAEVVQYLGATEFQCGNYGRAQRYLEEFVRIQNDSEEEKTEELVQVLLMDGNIHKLEGRESMAAESFKKAYQVFQEIDNGDKNPELEEELSKLLPL